MKIKKMFLWLLLPITFFGFFTGAIVYKTLNPYKASIYNYQSYVNPELIPEIEKNYSYKVYESNSEFVNAMNNSKAVAGISTDYMIVDLINNQKVSKINFEATFGISDPLKYYTKQTIAQLEYFDKYLGDVDGDGKNDRFWEYIIPIWINNKVFIYNSDKIKKEIPDFSDHSYINILNQMTNYGVDVISWTNAPIENSVIGSEIDPNVNFNTELDFNNYEKRIDEFATIIKKGTGHEVNDGSANIFEDDSDVVLQSTIDPNSIIKGSYLFNGDALDAYWSMDNFNNVQDGTIKLIQPQNSPSFIDGFVVSSSITEKEQIELLKNMDNIFFRGKFMMESEIDTEIKEDGIINWEIIPSLYNFDFVNYTPTSIGEYDFILKNYFEEEDNPTIAKKFYEIKNINPIQPLNQELQSKIIAEFKRRLRL